MTSHGEETIYYYKGGWNFRDTVGHISKYRYDIMSKTFTQNKVCVIRRTTYIINIKVHSLFKKCEKMRNLV